MQDPEASRKDYKFIDDEVSRHNKLKADVTKNFTSNLTKFERNLLIQHGHNKCFHVFIKNISNNSVYE